MSTVSLSSEEGVPFSASISRTFFTWNKEQSDKMLSRTSTVFKIENCFQNFTKTLIGVLFQRQNPKISCIWHHLQIYLRWVQSQLYWMYQEILGKTSGGTLTYLCPDRQACKWPPDFRTDAARQIWHLHSQTYKGWLHDNWTWKESLRAPSKRKYPYQHIEASTEQ